MNFDMNGDLRILVVTAVSLESDAVVRGLKSHPGFHVLMAGVGPTAAAAATAKALASAKYDMVISMGIGGGFPGKAEVGSVVVADEIVAADLGVETQEGFQSIDELGFGTTRYKVDAGLVNRVAGAMRIAGLPVTTGSILTVSTVTGTASSALQMVERVPGAVVEAMEGYGVAVAAHASGVPFMEIRSVSNMVGPRDRTAWRIKEALDVLDTASVVLSEVLV